MKYFYLVFFALSTTVSLAQPLEQEDFVLELGMGYPNLSYLSSSGTNFFHFDGLGGQDQSIHKSTGQFILNSEFMLTDKLGFALSMNYGNYYDYSTQSLSVYDGNTGTTTVTNYFYEQRTHRFRFYIGPNFHLFRSDRVDSYLGIKACIKKSIYDLNSNDPSFTQGSQFEIPVGLRISYGFRVFLSEYLAFHAKLGLGGPAISFGLTYKLTE